MLAEGLHPGGIAYVAAMEACARGGVIDNAIELLEKILREHPSDKEVRDGSHDLYAQKGRNNISMPFQAALSCHVCVTHFPRMCEVHRRRAAPPFGGT